MMTTELIKYSPCFIVYYCLAKDSCPPLYGNYHLPFIKTYSYTSKCLYALLNTYIMLEARLESNIYLIKSDTKWLWIIVKSTLRSTWYVLFNVKAIWFFCKHATNGTKVSISERKQELTLTHYLIAEIKSNYVLVFCSLTKGNDLAITFLSLCLFVCVSKHQSLYGIEAMRFVSNT